MYLRTLICALLPIVFLTGCGEKKPSETDFLDVIDREWLGPVNNENQDSSIEIMLLTDGREVELSRSNVIDTYGDRLTGFGYAQLVTTTMYKKTISQSQLRSGGDITTRGISIIQIDNNSHWELFENENLGRQEIPPTSIEVLEEVLHATQARLDEIRVSMKECGDLPPMYLNCDKLERDANRLEAKVSEYTRLIEENE